MVLAAADAHDGVGEDGRESKFAGSIDNLPGVLAIDERFRDDEAWAQVTVSGLGRSCHVYAHSFPGTVFSTGNAVSLQRSPVTSSEGIVTRTTRIP
jgi:hypothetical protein